jgi:hypothetical protein
MRTSIVNRLLKVITLYSGLTLMPLSAWATTNLSCSAQTSVNTAGHVEVLPFQVDRFQLKDDEDGVFTIPIASTPYTYRIFIGFTEDPAYDEMSGEGTPGFTPLRTLHQLDFFDGSGLGIDTSSNRFKVQDVINLSTSMRTEKSSTYVSIFCHFR